MMRCQSFLPTKRQLCHRRSSPRARLARATLAQESPPGPQRGPHAKAALGEGLELWQDHGAQPLQPGGFWGGWRRGEGGRPVTHEKAALPSSMSLPLAPGPDLPHRLTAMHIKRPHLFRK